MASARPSRSDAIKVILILVLIQEKLEEVKNMNSFSSDPPVTVKVIQDTATPARMSFRGSTRNLVVVYIEKHQFLKDGS